MEVQIELQIGIEISRELINNKTQAMLKQAMLKHSGILGDVDVITKLLRSADFSRLQPTLKPTSARPASYNPKKTGILLNQILPVAALSPLLGKLTGEEVNPFVQFNKLVKSLGG